MARRCANHREIVKLQDEGRITGARVEDGPSYRHCPPRFYLVMTGPDGFEVWYRDGNQNEKWGAPTPMSGKRTIDALNYFQIKEVMLRVPRVFTFPRHY